MFTVNLNHNLDYPFPPIPIKKERKKSMYMNNMKELYIYVPSLKFCSVKSISNCLQSSVCSTCPHVTQIHLSTKTVHIILCNKLAVLPKISSSDSVKFWHIIKFKNCIVLKLRSRLWYFFDKLSIIAVIFYCDLLTRNRLPPQ